MIKLKIEDKNLDEYIQNPKVRNYLNLSLTLGSLAIFLAFAIRPSLNTALRLRNEIRDHQAIDQQMSEKIVALSKARDIQTTMKHNIALLDISIPENSYEGNMLKNLNYVAIRDNVEMTKLDYEYETQEDRKVVKMKIAADSDYGNVIQFINSLNNLLRITTVDAVAFKLKDVDDQQILEVTLDSGIYYMNKDYNPNSTSNDNLNGNIDETEAK